jgi:hypothetical protein
MHFRKSALASKVAGVFEAPSDFRVKIPNSISIWENDPQIGLLVQIQA